MLNIHGPLKHHAAASFELSDTGYPPPSNRKSPILCHAFDMPAHTSVDDGFKKTPAWVFWREPLYLNSFGTQLQRPTNARCGLIDRLRKRAAYRVPSCSARVAHLLAFRFVSPIAAAGTVSCGRYCDRHFLSTLYLCVPAQCVLVQRYSA